MKTHKDVPCKFITIVHTITSWKLHSFKLELLFINDYEISNKQQQANDHPSIEHQSLFQGPHVFEIVRMFHRTLDREVSGQNDGGFDEVEDYNTDVKVSLEL